jgi:hypothetical protein
MLNKSYPPGWHYACSISRPDSILLFPLVALTSVTDRGFCRKAWHIHFSDLQ